MSLDNLKTILNAIKHLLTDYPKKEDIPTKLPNPNPLTFTGAVTGNYDGSEPLTVEIPQGGGGSTVPKPLTYDYMPAGYPTKSMQTITLMEEQELAFALVENPVYGAFLTEALEIVEGKTYAVNWDGTEYECVCSARDTAYLFGNLSIMGYGDDTGEPFVYVSSGRAFFATFDTSASHTISVKTTGKVITPMAEEFLPSGVTAAIENAQTTAEKNKEVFDSVFSSFAAFTFDKQTSGRDTFKFNAFNYYKISDFNPASGDVISFKGTTESGTETSIITTGNNCVEYGFFIVVSSAGNCSLPTTETVTKSFTAPSAGLYARYEVDSPSQTAGTGEFTLRASTGSFPITDLLLKSSTADSTKKFKITVDDSGTISATEIV